MIKRKDLINEITAIDTSIARQRLVQLTTNELRAIRDNVADKTLAEEWQDFENAMEEGDYND